MTQQETPPDAFEAVRARLFGLAYRMLGSRADAEDIVQETYVRWHTAQPGAIENPEAWLVTAATRLSIDRLRRLKTEREAYVGPWLPEPIVEDTPERLLELSSDLSMAMLTMLGKSEPACRQVIHRARGRVRGDRKRFESTESEKRELLERFTAAMEASDEQALLALFTPDATWTADGGGKTAASPRPLVGVEAIVRLVMGLRRRWWADLDVLVTTVNGEPGLCMRVEGRLIAVMAIESSDDRIQSVYAVINPDKLAAVEIP